MEQSKSSPKPQMSVDSLTSLESSASYEDYGSILWMEGDSDSTEDTDKGGVLSPVPIEAPRAQVEDFWVNLPESTERTPSYVCTRNQEADCSSVKFVEELLPEEGAKTEGISQCLGMDESAYSFTDTDIQPDSPQRVSVPSICTAVSEETVNELMFVNDNEESVNIGTKKTGMCKSNSQQKSVSNLKNDQTLKGGDASTKVGTCIETQSTVDVKHSLVEAVGRDGERHWFQLNAGNSEPTTNSFSGSSLGRNAIHTTEQLEHQRKQLRHDRVKQDIQQGELLLHRLSLLRQKQEEQQVLEGSPPIDTVSQEPAYQDADSHDSESIVVEQQFKSTRGKREGENRQTGTEDQKNPRELQNIGFWHELHREKTRESSERGVTKPEGISSKKYRVASMEGEFGDDNQSDSGVSTDFSPCSTLEIQASDLSNETPVEREIRRMVEREQSLRRSRGLSTANEFVEIPVRKSILSQPLPSLCDKTQKNDNIFAGKKMQKEISIETQREQVLVQLGKVPGFYDKGTVRQLRERKQIFEAFKEDSRTSLAILSNQPSTPTSDISSQMDGETLSECKYRMELLTPKEKDDSRGVGERAFNYDSPFPCGPTLAEGTTGNVIILESTALQPCNTVSSLTESQCLTVADSVDIRHRVEKNKKDVEELNGDESSLPKQNPFFKLRSSMSLKPEVQRDIQEAQDRERDLQRQRNSIYGATNGRQSGPEVHNLTPSRNGLSPYDLHLCSSSPTSSPRQSRKLDLVWPPRLSDPEGPGQMEVPRSPQTARQKHPLLQRWESGMVNGHTEED